MKRRLGTDSPSHSSPRLRHANDTTLAIDIAQAPQLAQSERKVVLERLIDALDSRSEADLTRLFLGLRAVSRGFHQACTEKLREAQFIQLRAWMAQRCLTGWRASGAPAKHAYEALLKLGHLPLTAALPSLRDRPDPLPVSLRAQNVNAGALWNLGLPLDWGGRLDGSLVLNSPAEMTVFFQWLHGRDCTLDLQIQCAGVPGEVSQLEVSDWRSQLQDDQQWKGDMRIDVPHWAAPLGQALSSTDWKLDWNNGQFTLQQGQQGEPAVRDFSWTRESGSVDWRALNDRSKAARLERRIGFSGVDWTHEKRPISLHELRWTQCDCLVGVSPNLLASHALTDVALIPLNKQQRDRFTEREGYWEELRKLDRSAADAYLSELTHAGGVKRLLFTPSDLGKAEPQKEALLELLAANPNLESVTLVSIVGADIDLEDPRLMQRLAALTKLRQLAFICPETLPPEHAMRTLLLRVPSLEELRVLVFNDSVEEDLQKAWIKSLAPDFVAHPNIKLLEMLSDVDVVFDQYVGGPSGGKIELFVVPD